MTADAKTNSSIHTYRYQHIMNHVISMYMFLNVPGSWPLDSWHVTSHMSHMSPIRSSVKSWPWSGLLLHQQTQGRFLHVAQSQLCHSVKQLWPQNTSSDFENDWSSKCDMWTSHHLPPAAVRFSLHHQVQIQNTWKYQCVQCVKSSSKSRLLLFLLLGLQALIVKDLFFQCCIWPKTLDIQRRHLEHVVLKFKLKRLFWQAFKTKIGVYRRWNPT